MTVLYESVPLAYVAKLLDKDQILHFDTETIGLYGEVCLAQFYQAHWNEAYVVEYPKADKLRDLLSTSWVNCFKSSYDLGTVRTTVAKLDDMFFACKTAYPLLDGHSLDNCAPQFYEGLDKKELQKSFLKKRDALTDEQLHYGALDVYALQWLWEQKEVQEVVANNLAYKTDCKAQNIAIEYQQNGMPVIHGAWKEAKLATEHERQANQGELNGLVGFNLNVKSWMQKQKAFPELPFNDKGKQPTDAPTFKRMMLEAKDPIKARTYELVLNTTKNRTDLQDLEKYRESYYPSEGSSLADGTKDTSNPVRIRTFFDVAGAITGRFTSKGGDAVGHTNIQNIGRHFKHIFGYEESAGRSLVSADYSTAELIAGCSIFKVPSMRDLIMEGIDLHKAMASEITGKAVADITKDERQHAKAVGFGYLFGMGAERFQGYAYDVFGIKLTIDECKEYKATYYKAHPAIALYHKQMAKNIKRPNFTVKTALGRVVKPDRYSDALNIPVQGTIGETTKLAITYLYEDYPTLMKEVMLVNTVHDSIIIDTPDEYIQEVSDALVICMKEAWVQVSKSPLFHYHNLPMGVDVDVGKRWC